LGLWRAGVFRGEHMEFGLFGGGMGGDMTLGAGFQPVISLTR
jgi:hypothetical protein